MRSNPLHFGTEHLASVSTDFMLNLIAYNLIRIPKLLTA
jgi:hypothetical protein